MKPAPISSEPGGTTRGRSFLRFGTFQYSSVELLCALVLLFLVTPFVEELPHGNLVDALLLTAVMVSAVLAVGGRRKTLFVALLLVAPALAAKWANHVRPDLVPPEISLAAGIAFFIFVIAQLLRFIMRSPRVDANVLCAGISGYLMLGLLWMPAYLLVARLSADAFSINVGPDAGRVMSPFSAFYFSFITLCTVGYGDVVPVSKVARMLAVLEAITGLFYMAVMISRLVAVYSTTQTPPEEPRPPGQS